MIGNARSRPGMSGVCISASRARIQLRLPCSVLISPLWATCRYGCASGHDGNVLVEKRLCTSASADSMRSSLQVGEELAELRRGQHALVDERAARQRREVDRLVARDLVLAALADDEQLAVELDAGRAARVVDEELAEAGHDAAAPWRRPSIGSTGTSRQPSTRRPSSATIASTRAIGLRRDGRDRRAGSQADAVGADRRQVEVDAARAGSGRAPGPGCRRRRRCWSRRPTRRGDRGCTARRAPC